MNEPNTQRLGIIRSKGGSLARKSHAPEVSRCRVMKGVAFPGWRDPGISGLPAHTDHLLQTIDGVPGETKALGELPHVGLLRRCVHLDGHQGGGV